MSVPDISIYLNRALLWECLCLKLTGLCAFRLVAEDDPWAEDPQFLIEVVVSKYKRRKSQTDTVNAMPLYPTEAILWDENQVPKVHYTGKRPFPGLCRCFKACSLPYATSRAYAQRDDFFLAP